MMFPLRIWLLPAALLGLSAPLWLHWFEPTLFLAINAGFARLPDGFWTAFSLFGTGWGVLGITAPLLVYAPRLTWAWLCAAPFAMVMVRAGKFFIVSARPAAEVDNAQMRIVGEAMHNVSMPSGHTLTAFAVVSALYFALPATRRWRYGWLWLLAAGTGLSRIAVGAHWPGDVVVGASLGILCGLLGNVLASRMAISHCQANSWSLRCVALLLLLALYHLLMEVVDFPQSLPLQYMLAGLVALTLIAFVKQNVRLKNGFKLDGGVH
jgi:membrane-associated phospholipid phosphatase